VDLRKFGIPAAENAALLSFSNSCEQLSQASNHVPTRRSVVWRPDKHVHRPELLPLEPKCLANAALDRVPPHRLRGMPARNQDAESRRTLLAPTNVESIT
jgi:hypothetical protein